MFLFIVNFVRAPGEEIPALLFILAYAAVASRLLARENFLLALMLTLARRVFWVVHWLHALLAVFPWAFLALHLQKRKQRSVAALF